MKEQIKGTPQLYYEYVALNKEAPGEGSVMSPQRVRMSSSPLRNERQQQKKTGNAQDKPGGSGKSGISWS